MKEKIIFYFVCTLMMISLFGCKGGEDNYLSQRNREDINRLEIEIAELKGSIEELVARFNEIAPPDKQIEQKITAERIQSLIKSLGSEDFLTQYNAGSRLKEIGKPTIPYLLESLKSENSKERMGAIIVFGELKGIKDSEAVPPLLNAFRASKHSKEKSTMALVLGKIGDKRASDVLREALDDPSTTIQASSATALGMLKEKEAIPKLISLYEKGDESMKICVQRAVGRIGDEAFPELKKMLETYPLEDKLTIVNILDSMSFESESTALLKEAMKDENPYIQLYSALALSKRRDKSSLTIAEKYINSSNEKIKSLCEEIIKNMELKKDEKSR